MERDLSSTNSIAACTKGIVGFISFQQLPDHVRSRIWTFAASIPRVVEVHESHETSYGGPSRTCEHITRIRSHTRPPAILSVNHESRTLALSIYASIYSELNTLEKYSRRGPVPIYVNPRVDITYRGKDSCRNGDAFKIRYKNYGVDWEPIAATPTLAVDISALRPRRPVRAPVLDYDGRMGSLSQPGRPWVGQFEQYSMGQAADEIMSCARNGLKELIIVVGNNDDLTDITLVPAEPLFQSTSDIFYQALLKAKALIAALAVLNMGTPPTVKVMTPLRLPLKLFPHFPKLPVEIQHLIWHHASNIPRVISVEHTGGLECGDAKIKNVRAPSLLHVCRQSRAIQEAKYLWPINIRGDQPYRYYNPLIDTIHLPMYGQSYARWCGFRAIAVENSYSFHDRFSGKEAKALCCDKIVILTEGVLGKRMKRCELVLDEAPKPKDGKWDCEWHAKEHLEWSMNEKLEAWNKYIAKRRLKGLESEEWVVPRVEVARLEAVTQTVSPYSY